jgi:hypothetical protein
VLTGVEVPLRDNGAFRPALAGGPLTQMKIMLGKRKK